MKLGDTKSDEVMLLIAEHFSSGRCTINHPRNGRCVLERREVITNVGPQAYYWVVTECERPDLDASARPTRGWVAKWKWDRGES